MKQKLEPVFDQYKKLRLEVDALFSHLANNYPDCVKCKPGCSDCCHALFDLSLVEAMYLNQIFADSFNYGPKRSAILSRAADIDRDLTRLKREMFHAEKEGVKPDEIMAKVATIRVPCPLLDEDQHCSLYAERPITCRLYGLPLAIGGASHVCGFSGFTRGADYPAVQIAKIQQKLEAMSNDIAAELGSRFELGDIYVPVSMALLNKYDDAYFGIGDAARED